MDNCKKVLAKLDRSFSQSRKGPKNFIQAREALLSGLRICVLDYVAVACSGSCGSRQAVSNEQISFATWRAPQM